MNFDIQYANIAGNWQVIKSMFGDRIVRSALPDGSLLSPENIFRIITAA